MGKSKTAGRDISGVDERMSMNSLGDLHGRVDFFGIETKRAQKPIYQKLKVIQTWVFIQALMIGLLVAYLILLTVWLAPFFPMNYDTDDEVDDNTAAIASLQTNQTVTEDQVETNTAAIQGLRESQQRQNRRINALNRAVETLQSEVGDLTSQVESLNATVIQLEQEINNNAVQNQIQAAALQTLDARVTALELMIGSGPGILPLPTAPAAFSDDARTRVVTETLLTRVAKLECSKESIKGRVKKLDDNTQERFCNLTKTIGDVYGKFTDVEKQATALAGTVAGQSDSISCIESTIAELGSDLSNLNASVTLKHDVFVNDFSGMKTNFTTKLEKLRNYTTVLAQTLTTTAERHMNESRQTRERFSELDDLRALSAENTRVMLEEEVGKLQCEIVELQGTMQESLETCKSTILNKTQDAIKEAEDIVNVAKSELKTLLQETKENISTKMMDANATITSKLEMIQTRLGDEIDERELQYTHLCDRLDGVQQDTTENFGVVQQKIDGVNGRVGNLSNTIDSMKQDEIAQVESISDLNQAVEAQNLAFLQFKSETVATEIDLRNQTCSLQDQINEIMTGQNVLGIRMNNSENRVNDVYHEMKEDLLEGEVKYLRGLAELHNGQTEMTAKTDYLNDAYSQLTSDFGGTSHIRSLVEKIEQLLPQVSSPRLQTTNGPQFTSNEFTRIARDSGLTTFADSSDSTEDYDYGEEE